MTSTPEHVHDLTTESRYNEEHDNFYCLECGGGLGDEYYLSRRLKVQAAEPVMKEGCGIANCLHGGAVPLACGHPTLPGEALHFRVCSYHAQQLRRGATLDGVTIGFTISRIPY